MKFRRLLVLIAVFALVAGACSDRGGEDEGATGNGDGSSDTTAAGGGEGQFGTMDSPCGPAEDGGSTDTTAGKAAQDENDSQGISDESILVGTVSDPGFSARPGLNQEIFDAGEAYVNW